MAALFVQALFLFALDQSPICECGYIKLWVSEVFSSEMSQHLTDWYTFSHIIHGIIFYAILRWFFRNKSLLWPFIAALILEASWEIIENTPWVINAYREQALAQGYTGDSIINSIFDTVSMAIGFFIARKFPVWLSVFTVVALEVFVAYYIRDNLTLNILNFIYPLDFIYRWQSGL